MGEVIATNGKFDSLTNAAGSGAPAATNGLKFGAGSDILQNYEVIATLPVVSFDGGSGTMTHSVNGGGTRIGNLFFFSYQFEITKGTASGSLLITMPVTGRNFGSAFHEQQFAIGGTYGTWAFGAGFNLLAEVPSNSNGMRLNKQTDNTLALANVAAAELAAVARFTVSGCMLL
jgi:hypothetical protein